MMEPTRYTIRKGKIEESDVGSFASREEAEKELAKRQKRNARRRAIDEAYRSVGMRKVRGNFGGMYYE